MQPDKLYLYMIDHSVAAIKLDISEIPRGITENTTQSGVVCV